MATKKPARASKPTHSSKPKGSPTPAPAAFAKPAARKAAPKAVTPPARKAVASALKPVITLNHDQIAQRAYDIWIAKGFPQGQDSQNWSEAEQQLQLEIA